MTTEKLFDVVIYELATGHIDSVVGTDMRMFSGHYNASRRMATVMPRLNSRFSVVALPAGKYSKGDTLKPEDTPE